ncbi:MAG: 30S ribosomal protein S8 [bacterium]
MTDPIADMLTRIRNASAIGKEEVVLPMSKLKYNIAKILKQNHWIEDAEVLKADGSKNGSAAFDQLRLVLKYNNGKSVITLIKRISKPSRRVYVNKNELPRVLNNMGMAIISTSHGLMTNKEAGKKQVGGEVVCEIY